MQVSGIHRAVVHAGQITVCGLALPDGQQVQVVVTAALPEQKRSISQVRALLRRCVERYDAPFEPSIHTDMWEMLK